MSKRRISKQQSKRIAKKQANYHQIDKDGLEFSDGLVISRFGSHAEVEDLAGIKYHCSIRPDIDTLVAGDKVVWRLENANQGVIVSRYPRDSVLSKKGIGNDEKPVAANITQIIVVIASKPDISWPLMDSYLVAAELLQIEVLILLNKTDLPCNEIKQKLKQEYQSLDYRIFTAGNHLKTGFTELQNALIGEVSVFVGQSGVGKSSIIAALLPHETNIETQDISENKALGRHTTSNSRFYHLPLGGGLIDSPGVREFRLTHLSQQDITQGYREFKPYIDQCKFRNCNHIDSLGCAIKKAVKEHHISSGRYQNYLKLCQIF